MYKKGYDELASTFQKTVAGISEGGVIRMKTAALITAAGMSSRMGDFKPMLNIGSISIAKRVIATFRQAGIQRIVMITGYHAQELEHHLSGEGLIFLQNEAYKTTHMFDSVKIGLSYLQDKCDAVLMTPVDIPLFTADTVKKLMFSGKKLACPACQGQTGHPILIGSCLIPGILRDSGQGGLKGALERCSEQMAEIAVKDPGILHDADTPEDYSALLRYHNSQLIRPVVTAALCREKPFFDQMTAMLLTLVDETGSVSAAGKQMKLSYSSCWNKIHTLENQLNCTLVERSQGGAGGSASHLTAQGKELVARYRIYEEKLNQQAQVLFDQVFGGMFP